MDTQSFAREIVDKIKVLVKKGNVTKIQVSRNGETVATFPVNVGIVAGVAAAPWALLLAVIATVGAGCSVDVVKEDGQIVHIA